MVRFMHHQHKTTFAVEVDENDVVLAYAKATCGPEDQFCKRVGRVKSEGRLKSPRYRIDIASLKLPFKTFYKYVCDGEQL